MENTYNTQVEKVLSHLEQGRSITQVEAIRLFKCYRLSAIIKHLRNQGCEIVTYNERNSSGTGTHARYEIKGGVMMNLSIFNSANNQGIRIAYGADGEPLFCLADVCNGMDMQRANPNRFNLNPKGVHSLCTPTNGGSQMLTFISEENLYRIIFRSNKKEALKFQDWVFQEVLPKIRKTGGYSLTARQTAYEELNRLCMQAKTQKAKGSFHGTGLVNHRYSMRDLNLRIETCKTNLQLTFEGIHND
jgi:prophage antirepressor-like protein